MSFPGGKAGAGVYQRIINQIPPHSVYVEPFLGNGAVMRHKSPARRNVGVEIDPETAAAFHGSGSEYSDAGNGDITSRCHVEVHCCDGIEWLKHAFGLYLVGPRDSAPQAACDSGNGTGSPETSATAVDDEFCDWFVYCDPPYLLSTRRSGRLYRHEMTEEQHVDLLEVLTRLPCRAAVSGYRSPLYSSSLENWRLITFQAMTRGGRPATECLWMNYPAPTELHDYRWLGDDKRERERIGRKVRNWTEGLDRLPDLERRAIESAIAGRRKE